MLENKGFWGGGLENQVLGSWGFGEQRFWGNMGVNEDDYDIINDANELKTNELSEKRRPSAILENGRFGEVGCEVIRHIGERGLVVKVSRVSGEV